VPHRTDYGLNITPPMLSPGKLWSFVGIQWRRTRHSGRSGWDQPSELWKYNRLRVHFSTALMIGEHVYGSSGDFGPAPLT
jgi:hypothetical protein